MNRYHARPARTRHDRAREAFLIGIHGAALALGLWIVAVALLTAGPR